MVVMLRRLWVRIWDCKGGRRHGGGPRVVAMYMRMLVVMRGGWARSVRSVVSLTRRACGGDPAVGGGGWEAMEVSG